MSPESTRRLFFALPFAGLGAAAYLYLGQKDPPLPDPNVSGSGDLVHLIAFSDSGERQGPIEVKKIVRTDTEWRAQLSIAEYFVTRRAGTEPAFTGRYWNLHKPGLYRCVCCANALFRSEEKFESGTGWPSFRAPIAEENIVQRVEVRCRKCDAHLGHVFEDGPPPTHLRYCMNSAALRSNWSTSGTMSSRPTRFRCCARIRFVGTLVFHAR